MANSRATVDLNDQFESVQHAVWNLYPQGSRVRVLEKRPDRLERPSWRVTYLTHRTVQVTSRKYAQIVDWTLDYYGTSREDVADKLDRFEQSLMQGGTKHRLVRLLCLWRFNWQFPQVFLTPTTDADGTLVAGQTYHVRVSGVDLLGNESAASVEQLVTLSTGENAIAVRIPRVPWSSPLFKNYHVYMDGHAEATVDLPPRDGPAYPSTVITALTGTGQAPKEPSDTVRVRWMFMRVTGYAASSREDDVTNGVFTGNVSLQTTLEQEHEHIQSPVLETVETVVTLLSQTSPPPAEPSIDGRFTITVGA